MPSLSRCVIDVAIGSDHVCALTNANQVYTWGSGAFGQLGHGDRLDGHQPRAVEHLARLPVQKVACGFKYTACVTTIGDVYTFGAGGNGQLGQPNNVRHSTPVRIEALAAFGPAAQVSCGSVHTAVLSIDGDIVTFGCPNDGRLGRPVTGANVSKPSRVEDFRTNASQWGKPTRVACGAHHTAVVTDGGCLLTFGDGSAGQLGLGDQESRETPSPVPLFGSSAAVQRSEE